MLASSEARVALPPEVALHARTAGQFVKTANKFQARISIGAGGAAVDAKSILAVLALGATGGTVLHLTAEGDDAAAALAALTACVAGLVE